MRRGSLVRRVRHWVANRGWKGFLAEVMRRMELALRGERRGGERPTAEGGPHPFDRRYGVETSGLVWGESLGLGGAGEQGYWATGYYGIAPSVFSQAMDRLGLDWPRYTFADIGCGKGRALMLALRYPLRRVVGVELAPELVRVARENLERFRPEWRREVPVEAVEGDATQMELPAGPLLLYLYHPFAAPVMIQFLERVEASLKREPRELYLLYTNPELDGLVGSSPSLVKMWDECFGLDEEDRAADQFGSPWERMVAYRSRAAEEIRG